MRRLRQDGDVQQPGDRGGGIYQLDAVGPEEEEDWMSVIDEEDNPHAFLGEGDDWAWGGDLDKETDELPDQKGVQQPGEDVLFEGENKRGTPAVGHRLLHTLCKNGDVCKKPVSC